ncbi:D-glycero-alpha-D-manno-heptose-1,7-bisphosphate 7-phosphatase [Chondromyces crocatus]|uniref:D,D-heptose 1,7-bisphosphate phosphatase n=1 Tax=Chondromyces crocatus TaxID=52 RepID=A0A0K1EJP8_CHOCO|nr:HAD-IIIA family hydrolase [Chondromyces crocatus]AKT40828.1 sugar phosphatase [Chondromyces crocatus]
MAGRPGIILDRDGTIIDVVRDPELGVVTTAFHPRQLRLLPGALEGMQQLVAAGFTLAIATNQPGAAKGQIPWDAIERTNGALLDLLRSEGVPIEALEVCPHHPEGGPGGDPALVGPCACRKPAPGMMTKLARTLHLEPSSTWVIGDTPSDVTAARAAGMKAALVFDPRRCELCPLRGGPEASCPSTRPDLAAPRIDRLAESIIAISARADR